MRTRPPPGNCVFIASPGMLSPRQTLSVGISETPTRRHNHLYSCVFIASPGILSPRPSYALGSQKLLCNGDAEGVYKYAHTQVCILADANAPRNLSPAIPNTKIASSIIMRTLSCVLYPYRVYAYSYLDRRNMRTRPSPGNCVFMTSPGMLSPRQTLRIGISETPPQATQSAVYWTS